VRKEEKNNKLLKNFIPPVKDPVDLMKFETRMRVESISLEKLNKEAFSWRLTDLEPDFVRYSPPVSIEKDQTVYIRFIAKEIPFSDL
jgi:hypothetical protein